MKKVVRKVFWAWQAEEEEQWLNEMARDGWVPIILKMRKILTRQSATSSVVSSETTQELFSTATAMMMHG